MRTIGVLGEGSLSSRVDGMRPPRTGRASERAGHVVARRLLAAIGVTALVIGLAAAKPASVIASDPPDVWPTFHHDTMHTGVSSDTAIGASSAPGLTVKWKTKVASAIVTSPALAFNATLNANVVYVADGASMFGFDALTGHRIWTYKVGAGIQSSPSVVGNTVYFGAGDHYLYALDATNGTLQCRFNTGGRVIASPLVTSVDDTGPVVLVGDVGVSEKLNAGHEWAINGVGNINGDCTQRWVFAGWFNRGPNGTNTGSWSSPALALDSTGRPLLVFGSSNPDDGVYALDARDGSIVWRFQTEITFRDEDVGAPPTIAAPGANGIADGAVYVAGKDTIMYAIDLMTGAELWEFNMSADAGKKTNCVSSAALLGGALVTSYDKYVYSFDAASGRLTWRTAPAAAPFLSSPAISGGTGDEAVFSGDLAGVEHAYSLADGSSLLTLTAGGAILSSAAVLSGLLYFGGHDHYLYALG